MHSVEHTYNPNQRHDNLEDMEHKRVIDNFVVKNKTWKKYIYFFFSKDYLSQVSFRLNPLIQAEVSVLVDVSRAPYALFPETNECRLKFLHGTFVHKYVFSLYPKQKI
jgi:hypothetical protein